MSTLTTRTNVTNVHVFEVINASCLAGASARIFLDKLWKTIMISGMGTRCQDLNLEVELIIISVANCFSYVKQPSLTSKIFLTTEKPTSNRFNLCDLPVNWKFMEHQNIIFFVPWFLVVQKE